MMYFTNNNSFGISNGGSSGLKQAIKNITTADWTLSDDMYTANVVHNLGTDNLLVSIYKDAIELSMNNVQIIDKNTIKIFNDTAINCKVVLIAKA